MSMGRKLDEFINNIVCDDSKFIIVWLKMDDIRVYVASYPKCIALQLFVSRRTSNVFVKLAYKCHLLYVLGLLLHIEL